MATRPDQDLVMHPLEVARQASIAGVAMGTYIFTFHIYDFVQYEDIWKHLAEGIQIDYTHCYISITYT